MEILIIIAVVVVLLLGAGGALFLRGRSQNVPQVPSRPAPPLRDRGDTALDRGDGATDVADADDVLVDEPEVELEPEVEPAKPPSFRERLSKARGTVAGYFGSVLSRGDINAETWEELEEALILADVGVPTTMAILERVRGRVDADKVTEPQAMMSILKEELVVEAGGRDISLNADAEPAIWLFVGVNGVGKTTTIGKLANREIAAGQNVVLGAGDTFRAAAAEQLEMWAERSGAGFIRGAEGADPGSVVFDAVEHAAAQKADLVLADTAGRLHNKSNLMEELKKVRRVAEKGEGTVTEVLLVLDATTGQNGLVQAKQFTEAVDVTGVVLTKLDGSAKGGIVLAIQSELDIPVKLVGLGESIEDLVEFDADQFVDALFA